MCEGAGPELEVQSESLHRQVHPAWIQEGRVTSQAFKPTPRDRGCISVHRGTKVTAEEAYNRYTGRGHDSIGVLSLTVADFTAEQRQCLDAPDDEDDAHAYVDFHGLGSKTLDKCAARLAKLARDRGWSFQPADAGKTNGG